MSDDVGNRTEVLRAVGEGTQRPAYAGPELAPRDDGAVRPAYAAEGEEETVRPAYLGNESEETDPPAHVLAADAPERAPAQDARALRKRVRRALLERKSWQLIDSTRHWICPFCATPTGIAIARDRRMNGETLQQVIEHVATCPKSNGGYAFEPPFARLQAQVLRESRRKKLVLKIPAFLREDSAWIQATAERAWICPYCRCTQAAIQLANDPGTQDPQAVAAMALHVVDCPTFTLAAAKPNEVLNLFSLIQHSPPLKIRLEAETVFGRSPTFFTYPNEDRFRADEAQLRRLDYVLIDEDDHRVSRTHGVIDPQHATIRDLNSANGIWVNGEQIARNPNRAGPIHALKNGDVLRIGDMQLFVKQERIQADTLLLELARSRRALVGPTRARPDDDPCRALDAFLSERKQFNVGGCSSFPQLLDAVAAHGHGAVGKGILILALVVEPLGGERMRFGDEQVSFAKLLNLLATIAGSKVIALHALGDPTGLEAAFADLAMQDTLLLTSTVALDAGLASDHLEPEVGTLRCEEVRKSVSQGNGVYDSVVDGLDALVQPDSNVLNVDWVEGYRGSLQLLIGRRRREVEHEIELSYRLDDPSEGSYRVTHNLSSRREG